MYCSYLLKVVIIIVISTEIAGSRKTFRCNNSKLIQSEYFCDGDNDCGDRSDESTGCRRPGCGKSHFTCGNGQCVNISARCNTLQECSDGSDELNCGHELNVKHCTMEEGKFLCKDGLRCLHWNETCNGNENCFDGSDEDDNCFEYDVELCPRCPHPCIRTPYGPQCFYNFDNNTFHSSYNDVKQCDMFTNYCEQKCIIYRDKLQCSCNEHYKLDKYVSTRCYSNVSYGLMTIYSTANGIKTFNHTSKENMSIQENVIVTALTAAHNHAYWSVMWNNVALIFRKEISKSKQPAEELISRDSNTTSPITSIAIDWITENIYFTLSTWLSVCSNNGDLCTNLKNSALKIEHVALSPKFGFMFWSQNSESKYFEVYIIKSAMDGSDEHVLVHDNFHFFKTLVVDEATERLYWMNTELTRIESIRFNGNERNIKRLDSRNFFSFAEFENLLYWTMDFNNTVFSDSSYKNKVLTENVTVMYLHVYNPLLQHTKIPNPCSSGSCKGLCLIRPSLVKKLDYTCVCENFKNTSGPRWCDRFQNNSNTKEKLRSSSTKIFFHLTSSKPVKLSPTTEIFFSHGSNKPENLLSTATNVGVKIFFVILFILLFCAASYSLFKWKENKGRDGMSMRFIRKNDDDEL